LLPPHYLPTFYNYPTSPPTYRPHLLAACLSLPLIPRHSLNTCPLRHAHRTCHTLHRLPRHIPPALLPAALCHYLLHHQAEHAYAFARCHAAGFCLPAATTHRLPPPDHAHTPSTTRAHPAATLPPPTTCHLPYPHMPPQSLIPSYHPLTLHHSAFHARQADCLVGGWEGLSYLPPYTCAQAPDVGVTPPPPPYYPSVPSGGRRMPDGSLPATGYTANAFYLPVRYLPLNTAHTRRLTPVPHAAMNAGRLPAKREPIRSTTGPGGVSGQKPLVLPPVAVSWILPSFR